MGIYEVTTNTAVCIGGVSERLSGKRARGRIVSPHQFERGQHFLMIWVFLMMRAIDHECRIWGIDNGQLAIAGHNVILMWYISAKPNPKAY
jgi:hypothetical protein